MLCISLLQHEPICCVAIGLTYSSMNPNWQLRSIIFALEQRTLLLQFGALKIIILL